MGAKLFLVFLVVLALLGAGLYVVFDSSYQKSLEARALYAMGELERAQTLAQEAFALDPYNRMAMTLLKKIKLDREFMAFIAEGERYRQEVARIAAKNPIEDSDRIRIKLIGEVVLGHYGALKEHRLVADEVLYERASTLAKWFEDAGIKQK